jgi:pimeloyl-ACP methyl ester carboxylesterase
MDTAERARAPRRRWLRTGLPAALAVTMAAAGVVAGQAAARAATPAARPAIRWGTCPPVTPGFTRDPRQQCATVRVPLDYRRPGGATITIAVSRIPATAKSGRLGALLLNPGGPGAPGLDLPSRAEQFLPPGVAARYDLIGFDPRGVGYSHPVTCGLSGAGLIQDLPYPAPDGSIARNVAFARATAARCAADSGRVLPYLTTANTARDMDRIRAALGVPRISYYGGSYGTYLGAVYATLFPHRVSRMVLDSGVDPASVWYGQWQTLGTAEASRFPDAARYAAQHSKTVGYGATAGRVTARYYAVAARLDARPRRVPGAKVALSGNVFRYLTENLLYLDAELPTLGQFWRASADLAAGTATGAEQGLAAAVINQFTDPPTSAGVPRDNEIAAEYAVVCDDVSWPRSVATYARNAAASRARWPLTDGMPGNISPCAFWKYRAGPPVRVLSRGPRDILILQNERDPSTDLQSGRGLARALGRRAVLVTVDAGGHGVIYDQSPCAHAALDTFLATGHLPARNETCPN